MTRSFYIRITGRLIILQPRRWSAWSIASSLSALIVVTDVSAGCSVGTSLPHLTFATTHYSEMNVQSPVPFTLNPRGFHLEWQGHDWQFKHHYLALAFPGEIPEAPSNNGHLHALTFGYYGNFLPSSTGRGNDLHWSVLPTMVVSSNQIRNPEKLKLYSFRLDGHLIWQNEWQTRWSLLGGLCLGAWRGEYGVIPVVGMYYKELGKELQLAYPESRFTISLTPALRIHGQWSLSGNEWYVLDRDLKTYSDFNLVSQRINLGVTVFVSPIGDIDASWFSLFRQNMRYQASNGARISADTGNSNGWMIHYTYHFERQNKPSR